MWTRSFAVICVVYTSISKETTCSFYGDPDTDEDHVHVFVGAHPKIAPARLVQILKSKSAQALFTEFPEVKQFLWGGAMWSVGYYVRTVSDGPLEGVIKAYVEDQGKHRPAALKPYQLKLVP
jgi:hypothetical protein